MSFQYHGYCYSTLDDIIQVELSEEEKVLSNGIATITGVTVTNATTGTVQTTFTFKQFSNSVSTNYTTTRSFPTCTTVGFVPPSSNLEMFAQQYLAFDPAIFAQLVGGSLIAFATGIGVAAVIKLMQRT